MENSNNLLDTVEGQIRDRVKANEAQIVQHRLHELEATGLPAAIAETGSAVLRIDKILNEARTEFQRYAKIRVELFRHDSATAVERNAIKCAIDEFNILAGTPGALRDGQRQFEDLKSNYPKMIDAYDRQRGVRLCQEKLINRDVPNFEHAINRARQSILDALAVVDLRAKNASGRHPPVMVRRTTAPSVPVVETRSDSPKVESEF